MGYDIHITRRASWADEGEPEITLDEWQAVVEADPDLIRLHSTPENPLTAMILSPHRPDPGARYFHYCAGQIFVKNPNKAVLLKMLAVARILNARVMGDGDEVYGEDGTPSHAVSYTVNDSW